MSINYFYELVDRKTMTVFCLNYLCTGDPIFETFLSRHLLDELRVYWQKYKPGRWIFPGYDKEKHIGYSGASEAYDIAKKKPA